jgi:hypothetical protein
MLVAEYVSPERLELCRLVREHCYSALESTLVHPDDGWGVLRAEAALEVPIETMAGWFMMDETMMANLRLAMTMVQDDLVY